MARPGFGAMGEIRFPHNPESEKPGEASMNLLEAKYLVNEIEERWDGGTREIPPLCACGCGLDVNRSKKKPYDWNEFISGHNARIKGRTAGQFRPGHKTWKLRREIKPNSGSFKIGSKPVNYKGGRAICDGYVMILQDDGTRKAEHRIVAEKMLGREIREEVVHHINGNTLDNRPENLLVMSKADHMRLHDPRGWNVRKVMLHEQVENA